MFFVREIQSLGKILLVSISLSFGGSAYASNNPRTDLSEAELREDLEYFAKALPKHHINAFHTLSKADFDREIEALIASLSTMTSTQVTAELMRITNKISDGHTSVSWYNFTDMYPFEITIYENRFIVTGAKKEYEKWLGHEITHIDSMPISDVAEQIAPYTSNIENEWSWKNKVALFLMQSDLLNALNITSSRDKADFTFLSEDGAIKSTVISAIDDDAYFDTGFESALTPSAGFLMRPESAEMSYLWFQPVPDGKSVYVRFDSYPRMEEMKSFAQKLARFIEGNNLSRLIIDLRHNGGGDTYVGLMMSRPLVTLKSLDWLNGVYVLTGRETFSAGMANAAQYKQLLNAKLVGEPTGADPSGYQDLGVFELPNSKRNIYYSQRVFRFQDTNSEGIQPDLFIPRDWVLEKTGRDPVLEWILAN